MHSSETLLQAAPWQEADHQSSWSMPLCPPWLTLLTKTHTGELQELSEAPQTQLPTHSPSVAQTVTMGCSMGRYCCLSLSAPWLYQLNQMWSHGKLPGNHPCIHNTVFINYDRVVPYFHFRVVFYHQSTLHSNGTLHASSQTASPQYSHLWPFQLAHDVHPKLNGTR